MTNCPVCKTKFISKGFYNECGRMDCHTFLIGNSALHIEFDKVKLLLKSNPLRTNKLAQSFAKFLDDKGFLTNSQLAYIVGNTTPKGGDTLSKIYSKRAGSSMSLGTLYKDIPSPVDTVVTPVVAITKKKEFKDSEITVVDGNEVLYKTKDFPHMTYGFPEFNPLQSTTVKYTDKDVNIVVAASTSSGKTIVAEQYISSTVASGKKAIYISPLKALTQEKYDDWTDKDHSLSRYKTEILTGDYSLTPDRVSEISNANIILLTSEMLDSRTRKIATEKNDWLLDVGVMVIDESHLLHMDGRGDNLESAIMRFTEQNPSAKIVFLSATMPNVQELANWLTFLNGKDSVLIKSDWRPVKLDVHYPFYDDTGYYKEIEQRKAEEAIQILRDNPNDKFIVFVHTKALGRILGDMITRRLHETVEFHSADLSKENRVKLEKSFKQKEGGLRILIATSTLAWGINAPARRVIVAGVHRGMSEVTAMEIIQMIGRSGRYGIDEKGDAYILVPESNVKDWKDRISNSENVLSRMTDSNVLSFHIISEIVRGVITNRATLLEWYARTLASFQNAHVDMDKFIQEIENTLVNLKAMKIVDDIYEPTGLGKVSAWMYYHPSDIYNWYNGFSNMVKEFPVSSKILTDPMWLAYALSIYKELFPPASVSMHIEMLKDKMYKKGVPNPASYVTSYAIYNTITETPVEDYFVPIVREIQRDASRITQTIALIDKLYGMWKLPSDTYKKLNSMIAYSVPEHLANICMVKWVGGKKAKALYADGIRKVEDFVNPAYVGIINKTMRDKTAECIQSAEKILAKK